MSDTVLEMAEIGAGICEQSVEDIVGTLVEDPSSANYLRALASAWRVQRERTKCHACGAPLEKLRYDLVDGWCCLSCGRTDADE